MIPSSVTGFVEKKLGQWSGAMLLPVAIVYGVPGFVKEELKTI